ncbi:unnamed protein product [Soboliphyme baturini]|uniref:Secreted protein n=1 Tax=Soboliphyme baturini TaxID=241478 RepID=A0A183J900_9BILA|nr:unnamed protein product [Soboliphyme baturini]
MLLRLASQVVTFRGVTIFVVSTFFMFPAVHLKADHVEDDYEDLGIQRFQDTGLTEENERLWNSSKSEGRRSFISTR